MFKNMIVGSILIATLAACGGGGGGGGSEKKSEAKKYDPKPGESKCDTAFRITDEFEAMSCEDKLMLGGNQRFDQVSLKELEECYSAFKALSNYAGVACGDGELPSASDFSSALSELESMLSTARSHFGEEAEEETEGTPVPAKPETSTATKCEKAEKIYLEQESLQCEQFEDGIDESSMQTRAQQAALLKVLKPCVANLKKLSQYAGLSCSDFDVPSKAEFDSFLPALEFLIVQLEQSSN